MDNIPPGQMIGTYRIVSQIGQGGMATVYKAYHAAMDRYVAIKVLPKQFAESQEFIGRFQQEARTIANLEHPHILPVYDYGESNGITYFVMRFLDTGTLKDRIKAGPMSLSEADRMFTQLAEALGYAHDRGVIHRDMKPSNVLVDARGGVFLTDFGIAKLMEGAAHFTATGSITGTPAYMSPEQAQGDKIDLRSDIYSLGIVLYEMITGRVPFEAETPLAVILKQLQAPLPPPSSLVPDLSPEIERVLLKALSKNRDDRYATCGEFLEAWKTAFSSSETVRAPKMAVSPEATIAAPPPAPAVSKARPESKKEAAAPATKKRTRSVPILQIIAGAVLVPFICLLCAIVLPRVVKSPEDRTATAQARLATPVAETPGATPLPPVEEATPTVEAASSEEPGWTSWMASNIVYGATLYGDQIAAWGPGGITLWNRVDGTLTQRITPADGLPEVQVNYVLADEARGGLWAATEGGLGFFDGERWVIYGFEEGLDSTSVTALALTSQHLLVGTAYSGVDGGGLLQFDGQTWEPVPDFPSAQSDLQPDLLSYNVQIILPIITPEATTVLWVGTMNGLGYYDGQTWTRYTVEQGLPSNNIWALMVDDNGELLVGTDGGAARFNGESFEAFEQTQGRPINGIVQDANGDYWFSGSGGVARYNPAAADWQTFSEDSGDVPVYEIFRAWRDPDSGTLYFGSYGGGLIRYDGQFTSWLVPNTIRLDGVGLIVPAPDGTLWFAEEYGAQVDQFDPATGLWSPVELPCDYCVPLTFDVDGRLWLGGELGAWVVEGDQVTNLTAEQGLPSNVVFAIAFAPDGFAWIGTDAGVAVYDRQSVTQVINVENTGLASNRIRAISKDSSGAMWVATDGGLSHFTSDGEWEHFTAGNPFSEGLSFVTDLAEAQGILWVATDNDGFYRFADGEWEQWPADSLFAAAVAPDGSAWFGAYYHGAGRFANDEWEQFEVKDGLIHPNVTDIYVDEAGTVWFATSGGVSRYVP